MNKIQTIKTPTGDEMVVLPRSDYDRLLAAARERLEEEIDLRAAGQVLARLERGEEPTLPHDVVKRLGRENAIKVLREHRGMTQRELADAVGLNALYLSQIETGRATGGLGALTRLAKVLGVSLDLIVAAARQKAARGGAKKARRRT
jgi:ribosome-binding protein aMBF1 (putative translation factor)